MAQQPPSPAPDWSAPFDDLDESVLRRRRGAKWMRYGPDVLPAWVADMDFAPAPPVARALAEQLATGDLGYAWPGEPNEVAVAFTEWASRRYGWSVQPDQVVLTVDVLQPIAALIDRCSEPGDGVVVQTPIYPPFLKAVEIAGRTLVDNPLGPASDGYPMDLDGLRASLRALGGGRGVGGRARLVLLCNPHNPSGRVFTERELRELADLAVEHDLVVVSDEIHADLVYPGHRHRPFASLGPEVAARTVTLTSATKTFSIAGLRLAVAHFGSEELLARYQGIPRFLLGGASSPGIVASLAAWREGDRWVDDLVRYLDGNRRLVGELVADKLPGVTHRLPEATYLAWLDCRRLVADGVTDNPAKFFLERAAVGLNDGADFGPGGEGFVRLNFATSRALLQRVLDRLASALDSA
jgi:cystathionine beta-lyase